jgi:hypothetical protein
MFQLSTKSKKMSLFRLFGIPLIAFGLKRYPASLTQNKHFFYSFVHGRLPYENLKPDPVLKNLLLSMPQRKIVRSYGSLQIPFMMITHDEALGFFGNL